MPQSGLDPIAKHINRKMPGFYAFPYPSDKKGRRAHIEVITGWALCDRTIAILWPDDESHHLEIEVREGEEGEIATLDAIVSTIELPHIP